MEEIKRQDTKSALLQSAERLIAEKGLGSVSVKMITAEAGAKNPSAVHYHFGSIESLIKEVFARRYRDMEKERADRIALIDELDPDRRLVALLEAGMGPMMESCLEENGRLYVRFCLQFVTDPRFDYALLIADSGSESIHNLRDQLMACLNDVPPEKRLPRLRQSFFISLAQALQFAQSVEAGMAPPVEDAVREAAHCLAAYLTA